MFNRKNCKKAALESLKGRWKTPVLVNLFYLALILIIMIPYFSLVLAPLTNLTDTNSVMFDGDVDSAYTVKTIQSLSDAVLYTTLEDYVNEGALGGLINNGYNLGKTGASQFEKIICGCYFNICIIGNGIFNLYLSTINYGLQKNSSFTLQYYRKNKFQRNFQWI